MDMNLHMAQHWVPNVDAKQQKEEFAENSNNKVTDSGNVENNDEKKE